MTKKQIERMIEDWKKRLGLERVEFRILWDVPTPTYGVAAEIEPHKQYDYAKLWIRADFPQWAPDFAEQVVIHELLHVMHRPLDVCIETITDDATAQAWYENVMETFIDRIALRLYEVTR